jgi:hypothetical protein
MNAPGQLIALITGLLLAAGPLYLFGQKDDTVYLKNGDRITGELKNYEYGILLLSTEGMSQVNIEYDKINTIHSSKSFEIVNSTGFSYYGSIVRSKIPENIGIVILNDTLYEPVKNIVEIVQVRKRFLKRFYGSFDLGLNFYKSSNLFQYYLNGDLNYRSKKNLASLTLNTQFTDQKSSDSSDISRKNDAGLSLTHFFPGKWLGGFGFLAQQNTELDLEYRLQLWSGVGYDIVHKNPVRFYAMCGALVNQEKPYDSVNSSTNFEGVVSLSFVWHQYRHPKINISTNFDTYPSFSVSGRVRLEYDLSVKYEIVRDLYINLSIYDNYDSKPLGGGEALNDYGVVLSIGFTF